MAARYLRSLKYEVETAGDGFEAIELYKRASEIGIRFDVVILDLNIPGSMGAEETFKKLLEIYPHIKVIAASSYTSDPVMGKLEEYGFKDIFLKPYVLLQKEIF